MPTRKFMFTLIAGCLMAQMSLASSDEGGNRHEPIKATPIWAAEETHCQIVDLKTPWELKDAPDPEEPGFEMAELLKSTRPDFGTNGQVHFRGRPVLQLVIDAEGRVERIGLIRGEKGPLLNALVESVASWEFEPATHDGTPICSMQIVSMSAHY